MATKHMRVGTSHFLSDRAAVRYYARQQTGADEVRDMIEDGTISIGPPQTKPGQQARADTDGRYWIVEKGSV